MHPEKLETEIMKPSLEERAKLAERILLSLDAPSDEENLELWVQEAQRRLKNLQDGKAKTMPAADVFQKTRTAILCNA
jgi:putative addiction module component (TIGR02574 family)